MNEYQWNAVLGVVRGNCLPNLPTGFIVDCPWLPGWHGVNMLDYFGDDRCWFEVNKRAIETFQDTILFPGFWAEYGMCTEPSAFGAKCQWFENNTPHAGKVLKDLSEVYSLSSPNVRTDGLLPFVINRLRRMQPQIEDMGHQIKFAVARGPLNIASFLLGTTELMMGMMTDQDRCHKLIGVITDFLVDWIGYQIECFPTIEGILLLDDIVGFVGHRECGRFVVPYFKRIYGAFEAKINFLHNDANCLVSAPYLAKMGVNLFNPSFEHSIQQLKELTDNKISILGNIPPRDVLAAGSPQDVAHAVKQSVAGLTDMSRLILSCGGGMPQGVSTENIRAFVSAANSLDGKDKKQKPDPTRRSIVAVMQEKERSQGVRKEESPRITRKVKMNKNELSPRAFTLIELLVVIAIIGLLLSIIVPSLKIAKEQAKKITCTHNLKSIGTAIYLFVNSNDDLVPEASYRGGSTGSYTEPYYSYMAYQIDSNKPWGQHITAGPSNLAYLYDSDLIDTPETFYCDSAVKQPDGPSDSSQVSYHYDGYHDAQHPWPWNTQAGIGGLNFHVVRVSYNYVPQSSMKKDDMGFPAIAKKASEFHASYPLCTDLIKDIYTLPHKKGSGKFAGGLNVLFSDGHAEFCNNPEAFDDELWLSGSPNSDPLLFRTILSRLR